MKCEQMLLLFITMHYTEDTHRSIGKLFSKLSSGGSRIWKRGFHCSHKARKARPLGVCGTWGTFPPRKMFDFIPFEIAFGAVLG